jgi:hypothetical protein
MELNMSKDQSLAQEVADIRKIVLSLEEKIDQILQIMETFVELEDAEYESDDDEEYESNEGWISDVEWFTQDEDDDE